MDRARFRRQLFFFLLAVLLPCAVLVVFGVVFLKQQTQIDATRAVEENAAFARDTGRLLEDALNDAAVRAAVRIDEGADSLRFPAGEGVLWVGTITGSEFEPAWSRLRSIPPVTWGRLESALRQAEAMEIRERNFRGAARAYDRLAATARDPRRKTIATQQAARSYLKATDSLLAAQRALSILAKASTERDEFGVPRAYYAATTVLQLRPDSLQHATLQRLRNEPDAPEWFSNERTYMLADLLTETGDSTAMAQADAREAEVAVVDRMRQSIPGILRTQSANRWFLFGDRLVGTAQGLHGRHVFAVDRASLEAMIPEPGRVASLSWEGGMGDGLSLGPYLRDVHMSLKPAASRAVAPRIFFVLGLGLLLGLTLFGGYLLWRDVRRETRLARLRAQFVSSVSHELRTPLTSIRMFAETLMAADDAPLQDRRRYLGIIANESERLTRMLNNVLNASRIEQGTMRYHMAKGDVRDAVRAGVDAMQYAFDQEGVALTVQLPEDPVVLVHDPDALEQAVLNLLTNALKYGGRKPVSLSLDLGGATGSATNAECRIAVQDQGPGIALDEQERIFERFYRTESAQNQRVAGAGLGLALVHHIVEAHRGRIAIDSEPGQGSIFSIHLPTQSP